MISPPTSQYALDGAGYNRVTAVLSSRNGSWEGRSVAMVMSSALVSGMRDVE